MGQQVPVRTWDRHMQTVGMCVKLGLGATDERCILRPRYVQYECICSGMAFFLLLHFSISIHCSQRDSECLIIKSKVQLKVKFKIIKACFHFCDAQLSTLIFWVVARVLLVWLPVLC